MRSPPAPLRVWYPTVTSHSSPLTPPFRCVAYRRSGLVLLFTATPPKHAALPAAHSSDPYHLLLMDCIPVRRLPVCLATAAAFLPTTQKYHTNRKSSFHPGGAVATTQARRHGGYLGQQLHLAGCYPGRRSPWLSEVLRSFLFWASEGRKVTGPSRPEAARIHAGSTH